MKNNAGKNADNLLRTEEKVPYSMITAIYIHILIGWSFIFLVSIITKPENNSYLGLIPAMILILPTFWMAANLARIFPDLTLSAVLVKVFGKFWGRVFGVVFFLIIIMVSNLSFREAHLMVFSYFFKRTPIFLIPLFFIAGSLYMGLKGIRSIGRLASFMLIPLLLTIFGLELFGLVNINLLNLQPVLQAPPEKWLLNGLDLAFAVLPGASIALYMPFIREPKNVAKVGLYSFAVIFPLFFLSLLGVIGVFGPDVVIKITWPVVEFFHLIDYPYLLLEQAGLFFLIAWYASLFVAITQVFFIIGHNLSVIFPTVKRNWFIVALNISGFFSALIPINTIELRKITLPLQKTIIFYFLALLTCTWLIARWRFKNKKSLI